MHHITMMAAMPSANKTSTNLNAKLDCFITVCRNIKMKKPTRQIQTEKNTDTAAGRK